MTVHLPYGKTEIPMEISPERVITSKIAQLRGGNGAALVEQETALAKVAVAGFAGNEFLLALADRLAARRA